MKLQDFNSFSFPRDRTEKTSDKIEIDSFQLHFVYMCFVYIYPSFRAKQEDINLIEIKTFQLHFVYVFCVYV